MGGLNITWSENIALNWEYIKRFQKCREAITFVDKPASGPWAEIFWGRLLTFRLEFKR